MHHHLLQFEQCAPSGNYLRTFTHAFTPSLFFLLPRRPVDRGCCTWMQSLLSSYSKVQLAGGAVAYAVGVGLAYELARPVPKLPNCCERCKTFDSLAPKYDTEIEKDEATSGILELRKHIIARARGRVLEVAGGTGRNLDFYGHGVSELLITDWSEQMLQVAARKVAAKRAEGGGSSSGGSGALSKVTLAVTDASALALPSAAYDTVVDTFGLCSFEAPERALQEMARCCKPDGEILLLEHGVSSWSVLAWWQQHRLNRHVVRWGCYWNRDILKMVEESGLQVLEVRRKHLGTTYYVRCRPPAGPPVGVGPQLQAILS